jgi:uncharacterized Fe-S cluster-containing MiaB family protein
LLRIKSGHTEGSFLTHVCKNNKLYSIILQVEKDDNVKKIKFSSQEGFVIVKKLKRLFSLFRDDKNAECILKIVE